MLQRFILTGAPGSGKTSILEELENHGMVVVEEPARQILEEQRQINGRGVYDLDPYLFKELILSRALNTYKQFQEGNDAVIYDRGIPDVIAYSDCFGLNRGAEVRASKLFRYEPTVFYAPPWKEIYKQDEERRIDFNEAKDFGKNLFQVYKALGYQLEYIPFDAIDKRVTYIMNKIEKNLGKN